MALRHVAAGVLVAAALLAALAGPALGQALAEDMDWGLAPPSQLRQPPYEGPTPTTIAGARVISTRGLQAMLAEAVPPVLIDVAGGEGHRTLPEAYWIPGAGRGANYIDDTQASLAALLARLTQQDKQRPLVFFCVSVTCWLSYNAALRAAAAGYANVYWYRGGLEAWREAGLPLADMAPASVQPQ